LGNLSTPKSVQKLQTALHAKAKAEAGYRFYALHDKISREDILAPALCPVPLQQGRAGWVKILRTSRHRGCSAAVAWRTGACAPGGELPTGSYQKSVHPEGQRQAQDRVCMTAAMLVLEPIFEADLPPEQYAYRPRRNAQQAVVEVEELLFRGHPEVVDASA
jgi:RNA-directed DNA polymerase